MTDSLVESLDRNLPVSLSRDAEIVTALFSSFWAWFPKPTIAQSSDFNDGAIANELRYLKGYIETLYSGNLTDKTGDLLDSLVNYYVGIARFIGESDTALLNRFFALVQRGADTWGTPISIIGALSNVISKTVLYMQEDPNWIDPTANPNLLQDPDFELGGGAWTLSSGATIAGTGYTFSGSKSLSLTANGSASQTITIPVASDYRLTYVSNGSMLFVVIKNTTTGLFYDGIGGWVSSEIDISVLSGSDWVPGCVDIVGTSAGSLQVTLKAGASGSGYFDYLELGVQPKYPGFKVYISTSGQVGDTSLSMTDGGADATPLPPALTQGGARFFADNNAETQYLTELGGMSYLGDDATGTAGANYMNQIFYFLRPGGVRSALVFLSRT